MKGLFSGVQKTKCQGRYAQWRKALGLTADYKMVSLGTRPDAPGCFNLLPGTWPRAVCPGKVNLSSGYERSTGSGPLLWVHPGDRPRSDQDDRRMVRGNRALSCRSCGGWRSALGGSTHRFHCCLLSCVEAASHGNLSDRSHGRGENDLSHYAAFERKLIVSGIREQLTDQPLIETKNRKPLRDNPIASWELRIGKYRVFYEVNDPAQMVSIVSVGHKEHNVLLIRDQEVQI